MNSSNVSMDGLVSANYYAPRGKMRLYQLGKTLAERYLHPTDLLIGVIGGDSSGKSTLIRGLFPGLELTNDDEGVNVSRAPIFDEASDEFFSPHTYHLDVRYELAFRQVSEIADAVQRAVANERRVVVEHFDLLYEQLGYNARMLISVGEEIRVYRPTVFGPLPVRIKEEADRNLRYRLMAHSAEDLTTYILSRDYDIRPPELHSEVRHGFVIGFPEKLDVHIEGLEKRVRELISKGVSLEPGEGDTIKIGDDEHHCTGKRIHVSNSGEIEEFRLLNDFVYDPATGDYLLVGVVGEEEISGLEALPPM